MQRLERLQPRVERRVSWNQLRLQLLADPLLDAEPADALDVARTRAERQPVQRVNRLFILGKFLIEPECRRRGERSSRRQDGGETERESQTDHRILLRLNADAILRPR